MKQTIKINCRRNGMEPEEGAFLSTLTLRGLLHILEALPDSEIDIIPDDITKTGYLFGFDQIFIPYDVEGIRGIARIRENAYCVEHTAEKIFTMQFKLDSDSKLVCRAACRISDLLDALKAGGYVHPDKQIPYKEVDGDEC
jgi:hypothetical protein